MNKLQSNFTTIEQSKRLLKLGVPTDSADCYYVSYKDSEDYEILVRTKGDTGNAFFKVVSYTPCWSVGRLIEILTICYTKLPFETEISKEYGGVDSLVVAYNNLISDMDFSKLEK